MASGCDAHGSASGGDRPGAEGGVEAASKQSESLNLESAKEAARAEGEAPLGLEGITEEGN